VTPWKKQKDFLVSRVIQPEKAVEPIDLVEIESVFSKATQTIPRSNSRMTGFGGRCWV